MCEQKNHKAMNWLYIRILKILQNFIDRKDSKLSQSQNAIIWHQFRNISWFLFESKTIKSFFIAHFWFSSFNSQTIRSIQTSIQTQWCEDCVFSWFWITQRTIDREWNKCESVHSRRRALEIIFAIYWWSSRMQNE